MRKSVTLLVIAATVAASGCSLVRKKGDEFAVAKSAPLVVPPDFSLAPPVTGATGLSPSDAQQEAVDTLFGTPPRPPVESYLLEKAGSDMAKVGIRSTVSDPDTRVVDKGQTTLALLSAQPANTNVASANTGQ